MLKPYDIAAFLSKFSSAGTNLLHWTDFYPNCHFMNNSHLWKYKVYEKNIIFATDVNGQDTGHLSTLIFDGLLLG